MREKAFVAFIFPYRAIDASCANCMVSADRSSYYLLARDHIGARRPFFASALQQIDFTIGSGTSGLYAASDITCGIDARLSLP